MKDVIISDLSQCQPAHRLDRDYRHGTWRLIDYETEEFAGTMIYSGPGMDSELLTLPLNCEGYHAVYVGIHYPGQFGDAHVCLRLTDDPAYTLMRAETQSGKDLNGIPPELRWSHTTKAFSDYQVSEAFWKVADLTGADLIISRFNEGGRGGSYGEMYSSLVYVRLVPLSEAEIEVYRQELPRKDTRRLVAMNDAGIFSELRTKEDIWAQFEPYRDSDVEIMLWATFKGENCTYRSRIGRTLTNSNNPFDRFAAHERWDVTLEKFEEQGVDFMTEVVHAAHALGIRIFPSLRLQGPKAVPLEMEKGSFYERHPEFRCKDKHGRGIAHLSLAFSEVRHLWISLLCEALEYGFDGVHVIFCRSQPFVLYEAPVIERFREEYGDDPRECPDDDPRFWSVLSTFVTQFARELRAAVDDMSKKMGRKLEIAYNITSTMESRLRAPGIDPASRPEVVGGTGKYNLSEVMQSNMVWGVDVETLVKEGLVDYLMPHPTFATNAAEWIQPMVELVKGTPVKLYPDLYPRRQPPAASLYAAQTLYELGCDGLTLWDTYSRVFRISEWAMMKRLGHREALQDWRESGKGDDYFRVLNFKWIGDRSGDPRYYQTNG